MGQDQELVDLLWRNGQVVLQAQNHRKQLGGCKESKYNMRIEEKNEHATLEKSETGLTHQSFTPGDETAPWLHSFFDDPLEELCSNYFDEIPSAVAAEAARTRKEAPVREEKVKRCTYNSVTKVQECKSGNLPEKNMDNTNFVWSSSSHSSFVGNSAGSHAAPVMLPPKGHFTVDTKPSTLHQDAAKLVNFSHSARSAMNSTANTDPTCEAPGYKSKNPIVKSIGEPSVSANGSNNYETDQNQMQLDPALLYTESTDNVLSVENDGPTGLSTIGEKGQVAGDGIEGTSSSGASGSSTGKSGEQLTKKNCQKRKIRDVKESGCRNEGIDYESVEANRPPSKSASSRRSRAAEVHNMSERRRRDRINEKMRALQELIPHCNKSDKASMLDEAIEYLKSLQLQLQIMWMGGGMTPYIFPGIQHYLSPLAVAHASRPSLHGSMPLPEVPLVDQSRATLAVSDQLGRCSLPANPMQVSNMNLQKYYARQLSIQQMHIASQMMQHNQRILETLGGTNVIGNAGTGCENFRFCKSD